MKKKVRFHQSIGIKMIMIYILLLLIAIQVIGAYFADRLEKNLTDNFTESINDQMDFLSYQIQQTMLENRTEEDPSIESEIRTILGDYDLENITEIQVFDDQGTIIGTSDINQSIVGNLTNNDQVHNAINFGSPIEPRIYTNPYTGHRTLIILRTITDNSSTDPIGAVWIEASLEEV